MEYRKASDVRCRKNNAGGLRAGGSGHKDRALVVLAGDLKRMAQPWRLLKPRVEGVFRDDG